MSLTIKELIKELQKYPEDSPISIESIKYNHEVRKIALDTDNITVIIDLS
jgi:hypothetical protein